jgi:hypothetical protein
MIFTTKPGAMLELVKETCPTGLETQPRDWIRGIFGLPLIFCVYFDLDQLAPVEVEQGWRVGIDCHEQLVSAVVVAVESVVEELRSLSTGDVEIAL